jgi:tRNA modification GTPase
MTAARALPIIAIATAPGKGAIGIVRLSGPHTALAPFTQALLKGPLPKARHATLLPIHHADGSLIDRAIVLYFPAPHSYTGEDVLELHIHGGPVVLNGLLKHGLEVGKPWGLRIAEPGEFTQRAFLNGKLDLAQAEAVMDLIDASTTQAARSAAHSLAGAFSQSVHGLSQALLQLRTLVEAMLDFPEEEVDIVHHTQMHERLTQLSQQLETALAQTQQGVLLREGVRIVIAGQPNAGKSSLLNALAGEEVAIVTPIAGTTRDALSQALSIQGIPLHIVDTAGLRASEDLVERMGIERAWAHIRQADLVLFVHDLSRQSDSVYQAQDRLIAEQLPTDVPCLHIGNKLDLWADSDGDGSGPRQKNEVLICAATGQGLEDLKTALLTLIGWRGQEGAQVGTARARHVHALQQTQHHLQRAFEWGKIPHGPLDLIAEELRLAHQQLGTLTGQVTSDDLLGHIFSTFCIGK